MTYCIARHYGLPTRLLDWTANPLVALWFAVAERTGPNDGKTSFLYVLQPSDEDIAYDPDSMSVGDIDRERNTYLFQPFHMDRRITAQAAWFSVHHFHVGNLVPMGEHEMKDKLRKYYVDSGAVLDIRDQLLEAGISPATLFPDLSGIAESIDLDLQLGRLHIPTPQGS